MTVRVLVADDQALFREALTTLLEVQAGIEVVGEAANGEEAVRSSAELRPDQLPTGPRERQPRW